MGSEMCIRDRYDQFAQIEIIVSTGMDLFGGVCWPGSCPPRALWETGKRNRRMCQDNTGTLIWRLIRKKRSVLARGLLLLYRDAQVRRFAKQPAAEIGGSPTTATRVGIRYRWMCTTNRLPGTAGFLERRMVEWNQMDDTYLQGFVTTDRPSPPPSVYFLGFKSPGTQFGVGCVKLVWKPHAPTLLIRRG